MAVTISDIAEYAKVSVATVSRVLNEKPDVKAATRERVLGAIEVLGYSPSSAARNLVLRRSNVIGFIVPDITNPSFPELARGIVTRAKHYGYRVMFFDTNHDYYVEKEAIRLLRSRQVDGIILSFNEANREELERLKQERFPVVQIYRKSSTSVIATVALDNHESGYTAGHYLISRGHVRIGHITTGEGTQSGKERLEGFRDAMRESGIAVERELIVTGINTAESGLQCMRRLLSLPNRPTAVFTSHDLMAAGAYEAVYELGLTIPQDVSIMGHDNIEVSRLLHPKLTTIDTFKYALGETGVDLLMEEIAAEHPENREVICRTAIVERGSVRSMS
jgi:LacI family transcriptional regulator